MACIAEGVICSKLQLITNERGESPLGTDEPVEFEKQPIEVRDLRFPIILEEESVKIYLK